MEVLDRLPARSVHCVVTSPPYLGLRDYQIPETDWPVVTYTPAAGLEDVIVQPSKCVLGNERSIIEFVGHIVLVARKIHRVLRDDGTFWMNLGDSFNSYDSNRCGSRGIQKNNHQCLPRIQQGSGLSLPELKNKDLGMIPARCALALQADDWYLRRDIIWNKPNPQPESTNDRPSTCHEYVFILTKKPRYYYDKDAIAEPASPNSHPRKSSAPEKVPQGWDTEKQGSHGKFHRSGRRPGVNPKASMVPDEDDKGKKIRRGVPKSNPSFSAAVADLVSFRNKRSVWTVNVRGYAEAHFATFPPDLIRPMIMAGCPVHCCASCGTPWLPVYEEGEADLEHQRACGGDRNGEYHGTATKDFAGAKAQNARILEGMKKKRLTGHKAQCECGGRPVPGTVLDPFGGSGTTGQVAYELGRNSILIEIGQHYLKLVDGRTSNVTPGLPL